MTVDFPYLNMDNIYQTGLAREDLWSPLGYVEPVDGSVNLRQSMKQRTIWVKSSVYAIRSNHLH